MSCQLYLISPPRIDLEAFAPRLEEALSVGIVASFQLRLKEADDGAVRAAVEKLMPLVHAKEVPFILNDRPDLAAELGCDGVHLGQDDLVEWPVEKARKLLGEGRAIGVSAHASRHLAMEAGEQGADYVAFGAFFPTKSKPQEKIDKWGTPEVSIVKWWSTDTVVPCVAIGGMTAENCAPLVKAGADFIAAITAVWEHPKGAAAGVSAFGKALGATPS